jgi:Domain of unknown function (DUF4234)/GYF domain 2
MFFLRRNGEDEMGPLALADLIAFAADGRLRSSDFVRDESATSWSMAAEIPELRAVFAAVPQHQSAGSAVATPPPPGAQVPPPRYGGTAVEPLVPLRRAETGLVIFLSVITIGIYGIIWFYGVMRSYRSIAQRPGASGGAGSDTFFWAYVSCYIAGFVLAWIYVGFLIYIVAIVVGAMLLSSVLQDREATCSRIGGVPGLTTSGTHLTLWIIAEALTVTCFGVVLGVPLAIVQAVLFINDHNRIVAEYVQRQPTMVAA